MWIWHFATLYGYPSKILMSFRIWTSDQHCQSLSQFRLSAEGRLSNLAVALDLSTILTLQSLSQFKLNAKGNLFKLAGASNLFTLLT